MFAPFFSISQVENSNALSRAIQLFDNGNFEEAEPLFKISLDEKPNDLMVNYFYGACRTENNYFTNSDLECLIKANQEVSPVSINYYFGIQYHARSNWERALKFYNKYNSSAMLSDEDKQKILLKIQQCYDHINPYEEFMTGSKEEIIPVLVASDEQDDSIETAVIDSTTILDTTGVLSAPVIHEVVPEIIIPTGEPISFLVNNQITYLLNTQFKTEEGESLYHDGMQKQSELESSLIRTEELRDKYNKATTSDERKLIGQEILTLENNHYTLKKEANQLLLQAKNIENEYWNNASLEDVESFKLEIKQISENKLNADTVVEQEIDSSTYIDPNILLGNKDLVASPDKPTNDDLVYKIQIGAYSRGLPNYIKRLYNKLSLIRKIENYTDENGIVVYTTGNLSNYEDAVKMKNQVKQEGIEDAIVVPYFKGKRITLGQAKELEGEK